MLKSEGISPPRARRRFKPHRRRKRGPQAGLLLQVDATPFAWFKGDRRKCALHGGIDDATGQATGLCMRKNECLHGHFEMKRRTIRNCGVPASVYADMHTIFQSPNKAKAEIDKRAKANGTQFGRCLRELGAALIAARSPQAKGRIERLWGTLQERLPTEFAIRGITTVDAANEFLENCICAFNSEFAVEPENAESMFSKPKEGLNIDCVLCVKEQRIVDSGGVFSCGGKSFKALETVSSGFMPKGAKINVLVSSSFGIKAEHRRIVFDVLPCVPPKRMKKKPEREKPLPRSVPDDHCFKCRQRLMPKLSFAESDGKIIEMLEDILLRGANAKT